MNNIRREEKYRKRLFSIFNSLWGDQWEKQFKNKKPLVKGETQIFYIHKSWEIILGKLGDASLKIGVQRIREAQSPFIEHPPRPLQFYRFCAPFEHKKGEDVYIAPPDKLPRGDITKHLNDIYTAIGRHDKIAPILDSLPKKFESKL